jgi:hypothetical protein
VVIASFSQRDHGEHLPTLVRQMFEAPAKKMGQNKTEAGQKK